MKPHRWFESLMLRRKLIIAFSAMAVLTALTGVVGLRFVSGIGDAFSVFADVTEPLVSRSAAVNERAQKMTKLVVQAVNQDRASDTTAAELNALSAESQADLTAMRELARAAGIDVNLEGAEAARAEFVATLRAILRNDEQGRRAASGGAERLRAFETQRRAAYDALTAIASRIGGLVSEAEERAKVETQIGAATVDSLEQALSELLTEIYPAQRYTFELLNLLADIDDLSRHIPQLAESEIAQAQKNAGAQFARAAREINKLAGRLGRDSVGRAEISRVESAFSTLRLSLAELFESHDGFLQSRRQIEAGQARLDEIDHAYSAILAQMSGEIERRNSDARAQAKNAAESAFAIMAAAGLLALAAALAFGIFFVRRISTPLIELANHTSEIRRSGELRPLDGGDVNVRADEIGVLARSFNALIVELADARRRLIEWSEGEIRTQFERLNAAVNNMPVGLCMFDADQKLIICNSRYADIYGLDRDLTHPGTPLQAILEHRADKGVYADADVTLIGDRIEAVSTGKPWYLTNELRDGRTVAVSHQPLSSGGSIAVHEDITERRKAEQQIEYLAHYDALTDLPNRVQFREALGDVLKEAAETSASVGVLYLDLDQFKSVNDTLGHPAGDALLKAVAGRLRNCVSGSDKVARLGGDEFAIVQTGAEQPVGATAIADRLIDQISKPYEIDGHQVVIGVSIGIAVAPVDGTDPDALIKKADMALYRAKEDGRGFYKFFAPGMDAEMQKRRKLEVELRKAATLGEFELFYQPIVATDTGIINSFEALLRWRHPERGLVLPGEFVPLAEEIGLINQIGAWVLKEACREAMKWPADMTVSVNVSPVQFRNSLLFFEVVAALSSSGLAAHRLEVEITEAVLLNDTESTIDILGRLRNLGVRIAMDDFGTGYSSLGYLQKFAFDKIKIDRSFVQNLADKPESRAIVRAVAGLGSTLGIVTTAEGVETDGELSEIVREGCTEAQGFLFGRPLPASEIAGAISRLSPRKESVA